MWRMNIDLPGENDVTLVVLPQPGERFEAKVALWICFGLLVDLSGLESFVNAQAVAYWNTKAVGLLIVLPKSEAPRGRRIPALSQKQASVSDLVTRDDDLSIDAVQTRVVAALAVTNVTLLDVEAANGPAALQSNVSSPPLGEDLTFAVQVTPFSQTILGQNGTFVIAMNVILGLTTVSDIKMRHFYRQRNPWSRAEMTIETPIPPRRSEPYNTITKSIQTIGRIITYCAMYSEWQEMQGITFDHGTIISTTKLRRWNPPT